MVRQLSRSDLLVEQNRDGIFFYIRPDIPTPNAARLDSDVSVVRTPDLKGYYADAANGYFENIYSEGVKHGLVFRTSDGDRKMVYDYTFFDTEQTDGWSSAVHRSREHVGSVDLLRAYAVGGDASDPFRAGNADENNTDFFSIDNRLQDSSSRIFVRDVTARTFSDSLIDNKNTIYLSNVTLSDAWRVLRAQDGATIYIVNSVINNDPGDFLAHLGGYNAKIYYYNVLWNGKPTLDPDLVQTWKVSLGDIDRVKASDIVKLDHNPLPALDPFFTEHQDRYFAQVSVNGGAWVNISLPGGGRFKDLAGDTLARVPDLGNGEYRIRAWALDDAGVQSAKASTHSFTVTTSSFDYQGGDPTPDAPAIWFGDGGDDRLHGTGEDDDLRGLGGEDLISGNAGDDRLDGGDGDDVIDGGLGDDTLIGGDGADRLFGGAGSDLFRPGIGKDYMEGGDGRDTLDYSDLPAVSGGHHIDIAAGVTRSRATGAVIDRFKSMEVFVASNHGDLITGRPNADTYWSGKGDDRLRGDGGPDIYIFDNRAAFGQDEIIDFDYSDQIELTAFADLGPDRVYDMDASGRFAVSLASGGTVTIKVNVADRWIQYQGVNDDGRHVYTLLSAWSAPDLFAATVAGATSKADRLTGSSRDDVINGLGGNDWLEGGAGNDWLDGGAGDDTLIGGAGDDTLFGRAGNDVLAPGSGVNLVDGGDGRDLLDLSDMPAVSGGYRVDLAAQVARVKATGAKVADLAGIEGFIASRWGDTATGSVNADRFYGGRGADILTGGSGADVFAIDNSTDFGADRLVNFNYNDEIWLTRYSDLGSDRVFDMDGTGRFQVFLADGGSRWIDVDRPDRFISYQGVNAEKYHVYKLLSSWGGKDVAGSAAKSGASAGAVFPGAGDAPPPAPEPEAPQAPPAPVPPEPDAPFTPDLASSSFGAVLDYSAAPTGVTIDLSASSATNVRGSTSSDVIIGDRHLNIIEGGRGDDILTGGGGHDAFLFDNRQDFGADVIKDFSYSRELWFTEFFDLGPDNLIRLSAKGELQVGLGGGGAQTLTLQGSTVAGRWIEHTGVNDFGYHVYKLFDGPWPTEDLPPGATAPVVSPKVSTLAYGQTLDYSAVTGGVSVAMAELSTDLRNLRGTLQDDVLTGDRHANVIEGGRGDDILTGGGGYDAFVFDNRGNFGADVVKDFNYSRELWFTEFFDLGPDNLTQLSANGELQVGIGGGAGTQTLTLEGSTVAGRWIEHDGLNALGYHVYSMFEGPWPTEDLPPV